MDLRDGDRAGSGSGGAEVNLACVPPAMAGELMPLAHRFVASAIERIGLSDLQDVVSDVLSGRSLLWLAVDDCGVIHGAGVTELVREPTGTVCVIVAWGADDQKRCAPLLTTIEQFARDECCKSVRIIGRDGWSRVLPDYQRKAVILERQL